jgi:hypothetical protein
VRKRTKRRKERERTRRKEVRQTEKRKNEEGTWFPTKHGKRLFIITINIGIILLFIKYPVSILYYNKKDYNRVMLLLFSEKSIALPVADLGIL